MRAVVPELEVVQDRAAAPEPEAVRVQAVVRDLVVVQAQAAAAESEVAQVQEVLLVQEVRKARAAWKAAVLWVRAAILAQAVQGVRRAVREWFGRQRWRWWNYPAHIPRSRGSSLCSSGRHCQHTSHRDQCRKLRQHLCRWIGEHGNHRRANRKERSGNNT